MKKGLLILMAVAMFPFASNAQNWLTVKSGGGLGILSGTTETQPGIAINSGIGYKHQMTNFMLMEGDILLDTRSHNVYTGVVDADKNKIYFATAATYIQIPITAHFHWKLERKELVPYRLYDSKTSFYVEGGPFFGYALNITHYPNPTAIALWKDTETPVTESDIKPNKIDVGVTTGLGFTVKFDNLNRLNIGGRFNYGFLDIYKDARLGSSTNMSAVGHISFDFSLTERRHIKHRW